MDKRAIGMFDSGVGGLTVHKEVKEMLPNEKIIYLGDTLNFPYGSKSQQAVIEHSKKCVDFLLTQNVKMIIIACRDSNKSSIRRTAENLRNTNYWNYRAYPFIYRRKRI